jgi:hypothetical protein
MYDQSHDVAQGQDVLPESGHMTGVEMYDRSRVVRPESGYTIKVKMYNQTCVV